MEELHILLGGVRTVRDFFAKAVERWSRHGVVEKGKMRHGRDAANIKYGRRCQGIGEGKKV